MKCSLKQTLKGLLPFRRLFCLSLSKFWGLLAALVVDDLPSDACGFFRCMYMYVYSCRQKSAYSKGSASAETSG